MSALKPLFERGRVTDWLLARMTDWLGSGVLVGDGEAPNEGGWAGGEPGVNSFQPYVTLHTGTAAPVNKATIDVVEPQDWTLRYRLESYGGLREMADWTADKARKAWDAQSEQRIDVGSPTQWKAYGFMVLSMGAVIGDDAVQPMYWKVFDEVALSLTRCRA